MGRSLSHISAAGPHARAALERGLGRRQAPSAWLTLFTARTPVQLLTLSSCLHSAKSPCLLRAYSNSSPAIVAVQRRYTTGE